MKENKSFKANESKNNKHKILCLTCNNKTNHKVLYSIDEHGNFGDVFQWNVKHEITQCLGCDDVSFRKESSNSEDNPYRDPETGNWEYEISEEIFPNRNKEDFKIDLDFYIPNKLRKIFVETINSYNNENLILCGAGIRATVESLCMENNIKSGIVKIIKKGKNELVRKRNLEGKINGLYEKGIMTIENSNALHEHRFLGNESIHEIKTIIKKDLKVAIEILENTIIALYEIPHKQQLLESKRKNRMKFKAK